MSDGISWAYEHEEREEQYKKHVESGKLSKKYLERDISRLLTKDEIRLLTTRLVIHQLDGFQDFLTYNAGSFASWFDRLPVDVQTAMIKRKAKDLGFEVDVTDKLKNLKRSLQDMILDLDISL